MIAALAREGALADAMEPPRAPAARFWPILRWALAGAAALAVHAGGVWLALNWAPAAATPGDPPPAVMIDLALLAVAPEAPPQEVAPGPRMTEAQPEPEPDPARKPVEDPAEPQPVPVKEIEPVLELPPDVPPLPQPEVPIKIPEPPPVPEAAAVLTPPAPSLPPGRKPKVERKERPGRGEPSAGRLSIPTAGGGSGRARRRRRRRSAPRRRPLRVPARRPRPPSLPPLGAAR